MYVADTIVACATPAGRGAIAVVRCSGPAALAVAEAVFRPDKSSGSCWTPWTLRLGNVVAADGKTPVDQALAVFFPAGRSFTGEDVVELHCHGSPVVVEQVLASAVAAGARAAERGEFTRRAVLNGRLDLLQAEAVADLIEARMAAGARAAWQQLQGALSSRFAQARGELVAVLADIEAAVDFTEDELPDADHDARSRAIDAVIGELEKLLDGFAASRRQREGLRVVFTGKPNAGKSSLVNRLLGSGRMIVSEEPGTTRDIVEEAVDLGGVAFVLTDTAGIREAVGAAEAEAVERARQRALEADLRVLVLDAAEDPEEALRESAGGQAGADCVVVFNKIDLAAPSPGPWRDRLEADSEAVLETSAKTGQGCEELAAALVEAARRRLEADPVGISRLRHRAALECALDPLRRARQLSRAEQACELAAAELRAALFELSTIAGAVDNEEVLDLVFSEFCIGK